MAYKKRIICLELEKRPRLREVIDRLHEKTGMVSAADMILVALVDFDAKLPFPPEKEKEDGTDTRAKTPH